MDLNKKLIDQLSDLSRNIKSLTSEVKENKNVVSEGNANAQKEPTKEDPGKKESAEDQNKKFLKSLEGIFKKGVGEITKSIYGESKGILKDVAGAVKGKGLEWIKDKGLESALAAVSPLKDKALAGITSNPNMPKGISELLGKIPKFASGGVMDKTGLALVGEKGPEVVKLDKGSKVVPNSKSKDRDKIEAELLAMELEDRDKEMDKYRNDTKNNPDSSIKTVDQTLATPTKIKLTENSTLDEVKAKLMQEDPVYYELNPDYLKEDAEYEFENLKQNYGTFTKEDIQKLSQPVKSLDPTNPILSEEKVEKESKRDQRKKEKEEKRKSKEESKKTKDKDLLNPKKNEIELGEEKEKSSLLDKGKNFLKEKGGLEKGKNLLLSKGKDLLTGKTSLKDIAKNPASLFGNKSQLMGKGMGAATSLLSNKELRGKGMEKLKGLKKEKEEEKSSITTESPELKKVKVEAPKEEEKKQEEKKEPKKEIAKTESKAATPEKEAAKTESPKTGSESSGKTSSDMGSADMADIKSLLGRMVSLLEGPLSIETMDSPFRPDSKRF